jgi:hypothetical protein
MPRRDGTGPIGKGAMTGRSRGKSKNNRFSLSSTS